MLSQVQRPEISLSKRLGELITLREESIEVCALFRELLDESPVIWGSEIDPVTTAWSGTGKIVVSGKASDSLLGCLAAARASHPVSKTFGRGERHGESRMPGI